MKKEKVERKLDAVNNICELVLANSKFIINHLDYLQRSNTKLPLPYQNLKANLENLIKDYEKSLKKIEDTH